MTNFRTDLADERTRIVYKEQDKKDGILLENKKIDSNIDITTVKVLNEKGSKKINKRIGTYITINIKELEIIDKKGLEKISKVFCKELNYFIQKYKSVLIIGLGNKNTTADSLGTNIVDNIEITRHIIKYKPELLPENTIEISAIAPGVLGTTGIETYEILSTIVKRIKPELIIAIDSLITNDISRLLKTIQISDTGIIPGAGVNNKRKEISKDTMGIPVIAIGVPTLVEVATIVTNTLDILSKSFEEFNFLDNSSYEEKHELVRLVLDNYKYNLAVMPKEIDVLVDNMKNIISNGINMCLKTTK